MEGWQRNDRGSPCIHLPHQCAGVVVLICPLVHVGQKGATTADISSLHARLFHDDWLPGSMSNIGSVSDEVGAHPLILRCRDGPIVCRVTHKLSDQHAESGLFARPSELKCLTFVPPYHRSSHCLCTHSHMISHCMYTHTALEWRCDGTVNFDCNTFKILSFVVKSKQYSTWVDVHCRKVYVWQLDVSNKVHTCRNHCVSKCELL